MDPTKDNWLLFRNINNFGILDDTVHNLEIVQEGKTRMHYNRFIFSSKTQ
jgi:hypothetical protein